MAELVAVVNSLNRCALLQQALPSLVSALEALPFSSAIHVFDAGSSDGSREYVARFAREHPEAGLTLLTPDPPGESSFSDGCNQACAAAIRTYPDLKWLLFFETDNQFKERAALGRAIRLLSEQPVLAGVGFTVEMRDGGKIGFGSPFPEILPFVAGQRLAGRFALDAARLKSWNRSSNGERWHYMDVVYTSPLLMRAEAWTRSGPMDRERFPYTDSDVDLCWTLFKQGWRFAVIDVPGVVHDNGGTPSAWSARRVMLFHQSRFRLLRKHRGAIVWMIVPLLLLRHMLEAALLCIAAPFSSRARISLGVRGALLAKVLKGYE